MADTKHPRQTYRTTNWAEYNAALRNRGSLSVWLDKDMDWVATPNGRRGRDATYSDAAVQFCLSVRGLFGLPLRQCTGFVQSLLKLAQLDWPVPDYSTLCRRQAKLQVTLPYRAKDTPLELLIDSTGIQFLGEGEWKRKKHGAEYRRQWRKVHLGIDAQTLEIRAIEVTDNSMGDPPCCPSCWRRLPATSPLGVSALMGPTTPERATRPLPSEVPWP